VAIKNQVMNASVFLQEWVLNPQIAGYREAIGIAIVAIKNQVMNASAFLAEMQTRLQLPQQQRIQAQQRHSALKMVHVMGTLVP
jgi:hypothetical protein